MSDRKRSLRPRFSAKLGFGALLMSVGAALLFSLFAAAASTPIASGATTTLTLSTVPTAPGSTTAAAAPQSLTSCGGTLARDPQGDNWYDYSFECNQAVPSVAANGNVLGFALLATRPTIDGITFNQSNIAGNVSPAVYTPSGAADLETLYCNSDAPSDGFDCDSEYVVNSGGTSATLNPCSTSATPAAYTNYGCIPAGDSVQGSFQLSEGYCAYYPKGAKAGTPTVPRATVNLLVTDTGGAIDGPFELTTTFKCPKVQSVVPGKTTKKKATASKAKASSKK